MNSSFCNVPIFLRVQVITSRVGSRVSRVVRYNAIQAMRSLLLSERRDLIALAAVLTTHRLYELGFSQSLDRLNRQTDSPVDCL